MNNIEKIYQYKKKYKHNIIKLLEKILEKEIADIEYIGLDYFENIEEYKFSLFIIKIYYKNGGNEEVYIRHIKGGKIKESIFCFWSLIYEEYIKNNKDKQVNLQEKVIISQKKYDENKNNISITLNQNIYYCAQINLVELKEFIKNNNQYGKWVESLGITSEDILFIGRKNILKNS